MQLDPLVLSRIQFALTVGFHFLFPPLTIGLAWLLVVAEGIAWRRGDPDWARVGRFFGKILGLTFVVGVATGIVMEFQFGTNWAEYSKFVGDIFGAPLAIEAVVSFFLESTFLAVYLFGWNRVSRGVHWFSIFMVALGATLSAFWILVANSWQQTPAGYILQNGRAELTNFQEAVLNPSTVIRFFHTMMAAGTCGAFLMAGIAAYLLLRKRESDVPVAKKALRLALVVGLVTAVASLYPSGHHHARQVAATQPEKLAAMEGIVRGQSHAPLTPFGVPTDEPPELHMVIAMPGMLSWLAYGSVDAHVAGMEDLAKEGYPGPPFIPTFVSFHIMVGLGLLFILLTVLGAWLWWRGKLDATRWYLRAILWAIPLPLLACQLGWIVAEVGRQPWVVYRVLKTADAFSRNVAGGEVLFSIILFGTIYLFLGALYLFVLVRKIRRGPEAMDAVKEVSA
ncbi:MAG: cytochrome ubiquinol oxidase subunit I [Pirellulales bacterium]|nr:cytochrome ubiquinol oxidase subunit I [Pirellulales bacterium]